MANNKFNFTKLTLDALQLPEKGKRAYYYDTKTRDLGIAVTSAGANLLLFIVG